MTMKIKKKFPKGIASPPPVAKTNFHVIFPFSFCSSVDKKPSVLNVYSSENSYKLKIIVLPITRIILILSGIMFLGGFILPDWMKKIFMKEK